MADADKTPSIGEAWASAQAALPDGWVLDGLRCASTGLTPKERSEEWVAVAVGPSGESRTHRAPDAAVALDGLVASFENP